MRSVRVSTREATGGNALDSGAMTTPDDVTSTASYRPDVASAASRRWLVAGAAGQLGQEVLGLLADLGATDVRAVTRADLDITDAEATAAAIDQWLGDGSGGAPVVLNCAAYTAVDDAETNESDALAINGDGVANLARATAGRARLIHVSTDYVFAGDGTEPYPPDAPTDPKSAYGRTKLAGEQAVAELAPDDGYVVRTAWVYGAHGPNFVRTMLRLAGSHDTLTVVDDQVGSPTWTRHLGLGLIELALSDAPAGIYHCTGGGQCSWFDLARAAFEEDGLDPERVGPTTSDAFPRPAPRPAYSVLSSQQWQAAGLTALPDWRAALHEAFERDGQALKA